MCKTLSDLRRRYEENKVFYLDQSREHILPGGVCFMFAMDWLRRKYLNRPNFDDHKYASKVLGMQRTAQDSGIFKALDRVLPEGNPKRAKVVERINELQKIYAARHKTYNLAIENKRADFEKAQGRKPEWSELKAMLTGPEVQFKISHNEQAYKDVMEAMMAQRRIKDVHEGPQQEKMLPRGFDRLEFGPVTNFEVEQEVKKRLSGDKSKEELYEEEYHAVALTFIADASATSKSGISISLQRESAGHALALFHDLTQVRKYALYDPNFGEYAFDNPMDCSVFFSKLMRLLYSDKYSKMGYTAIKLSEFENIPI